MNICLVIYVDRVRKTTPETIVDSQSDLNHLWGQLRVTSLKAALCQVVIDVHKKIFNMFKDLHE